MSALTTTKCTLQYSKDAVYQDSSLLVNYTAGASLTFPYNYSPSSISTGGYFFMPFLNLSATHVQDTMKVEFLLNGVVKASWRMNARKPGWNVMKVHQIASTNDVLQGYDTCQMSGFIPDVPTQIRITFPNKTGAVYLGKVLLCNDAKWTALKMTGSDSKKTFINPNLFTLPATPATVTTSQTTALQEIANRLDEALNVSSTTQFASLSTTTLTDLQSRFAKWNIVRNGTIINGSDSMIYFTTPDYHTATACYGDLAFELAQNYRNTQSASEKATLLSMFYDLFDYGTFIGGMYGAWANGETFADATFLMRTQLQQTGRLTPEVLSDFKRCIAYDRIYLPYSTMAKGFDLYAGRVYRSGEVGEDLDYIRLTSRRMIYYNLLNTNLPEQVRDMAAISSYFSNIVFQCSPNVLDGFKPDGTLNHHWGWIDQYGVGSILWSCRIVYALSNTEFKVSQSAYRNIYDVLKAYEIRSLNNIIPATLSGKGGWPYNYGGGGQESIDRYACMALAGEYNGGAAPDNYMAQSFLRLYNNQQVAPYNGVPAYVFSAFEQRVKTQLSGLGITASVEPSGHKTLSYGAAFIHRRDNWMVSLKAASRYQYPRQSSDPWMTFYANGLLEVNNATWLRYGELKIQSDFGANGYDWCKLPGTTAINYADSSKMIYKDSYYFRPNNTFVGGVMQDGNGVFTMQLPASTLNGLGSFLGNKSYFCFDNTLVCVGSNISNTIASDTTITNLFQDAVSTTALTYVNNTAGLKTTPYNYSSNLTAPVWLMNSHNMGYWLPAGQNLRLSRTLQNKPNWANTGLVSGTFSTAWLQHGVAPKNGSYSYIMKINVQAADMVAFNTQMSGSTPPIKILKMNAQLHAVESVSNSTYAAAVINSTADINVNDVVSVSKPCLFMAKTTAANQLKLSVAYPDLDFIDSSLYTDNTFWGYSNPNAVVVKLLGNWSFNSTAPSTVSILSNTNGFTSIQFTLKDGLTTDVDLKKVTTANEVLKNTNDPIIKVYPNEIAITSTSQAWQHVKGKIVDMNGKQVIVFSMKDSTTTVSTSQFSSGVYMLILNGENGVVSRKIVK